jgi:hypothetical protein
MSNIENISFVEYCETNKEKTSARMFGHVLIKDAESKEIIRDKFNAINFENMSQALALSLADRSTGHIYSMVFGNGGSIVNSVGEITYLPPNVTGQNAQLYNQTYAQIVDDMSPLNTSPTTNYMRVNHTTNTTYSDVVVTCTLAYNQPSGQLAFDDAPITNNTQSTGSGSATVSGNVNATYIFDEIGLKGFNTIAANQPLLSHVIFHPVQKALNRSIEIIYTIRIYVS